MVYGCWTFGRSQALGTLSYSQCRLYQLGGKVMRARGPGGPSLCQFIPLLWRSSPQSKQPRRKRQWCCQWIVVRNRSTVWHAAPRFPEMPLLLFVWPGRECGWHWGGCSESAAIVWPVMVMHTQHVCGQGLPGEDAGIWVQLPAHERGRWVKCGWCSCHPKQGDREQRHLSSFILQPLAHLLPPAFLDQTATRVRRHSYLKLQMTAAFTVI